MIPPVIDPDTPSPGEIEVFNRLRDEPGTEGWYALHSLDLPNHGRQVQGEIDFVIVAPALGVLCLEIKAHQYVSRDAQGMWRMGASAPTAKSPFRQASEGMHALKDRLQKRRPDLAGVLFWSAVCFTSVDFSLRAEEWHEWQVIDRAALRARPITSSIAGVLQCAGRHVAASPGGRWFRPGTGEPTPAQCAAVVNVLRPEFETFRSPKARRQATNEELNRFTEDQFAALDAMDTNERVIFEGPAGTGKTLLAIEEARRAVAAGKRVLLCCYNRLLGSSLQKECEPLGPQVRAGTFHSYLHSLAKQGLTPPIAEAGEAPGYWEQELPELALEELLRGQAGAPFDVLIVDEAQDLVRESYLDVMELSVARGLAKGCWRMFGDFERQSIYGAEPEAMETIEAFRKVTPTYRLTSNCRNRPRIAALTEILAGLRARYGRVLRPDDGVEPGFSFYRDEHEQVVRLMESLTGLQQEGYSGNEVAVLSRSPWGSAASRVDSTPWKQRLRPAPDARGGDIRYCTVHTFKGLEAPAVVVTDFTSLETDEDQALLYVALTRAIERLVILLPASLKPDIARMALS